MPAPDRQRIIAPNSSAPAGMHSGSHSTRQGSDWTLLAAAVGGAAIAIAVCMLGVRSGHASLVFVGLAAVPAILILVRVPWNPSGLLPLAVLVLLLVPARNRFTALGSLGTPASLLGVTALLVWFYGRARSRPWLSAKPQPLRIAVSLYALSVFISYILAGYRDKAFPEIKAANRGILLMGTMVGVLLLVADSVRDRETIRRILKAMVAGGTIIAALGEIQFFTGRDYALNIRVPGMTFVPFDYTVDRSGFRRIVGTVSHPIELSVVLVLTLIMALHLVFTEPKASRAPYLVAAIIIAAAVPMTVSRTGVIALFAAAVVLFRGWNRERRVNMAGITLVGLLFMRVAVPGLLGTLLAFFTNSSNDPSRRSRGIGFDSAIEYITQRPLFGRGLQTYLPDSYFLLDDQMVLTLVEIGVVGLVTTLLIFWIGIGQTRDVRRSAQREDDRDLAQTLFACMVVGLATAFTYDEFSFPTGLTVLMISIGLAAAHWRILRTEGIIGPTGYPRFVARIHARSPLNVTK